MSSDAPRVGRTSPGGRPPCRRRCARAGAEARPPLVQCHRRCRPAPLDEPVGVREQRHPRTQRQARLADRPSVRPAERRGRCLVQQRHFPRRRRRAGAAAGGPRRSSELAGVRVEREEGRRRHAGVGDDPSQPARDLGGRSVLVGERAEGIPELPHQHRGRDAAAGDVADGEVDDAVGPAHGVVPVAADLEPDPAGAVAAGEIERPRSRAAVRQQAPLQRHGDIVLLLVAARPRERAPGVVGVRGEEGVIGLVEHLVVREQERHRPDRAPGAGGSAARRPSRVPASVPSSGGARSTASRLCDPERRAGQS